jgi:glycosyltransferase involved in cell wall biosynthesis
MLYFALTQLVLLIFLASVVWSYMRHRREQMPLLAKLGWEPVQDGVLIVVPAKDEADSIGVCLDRLMQLNGLSNYKVVAVNDRSSDATGAVMHEAAARHSVRIEVVDITHLPEGWLGKNHACWAGAQRGFSALPTAKYVLFTDGDVKFHPDTVAESITWMRRKKIDFMTLIEDSEYENVLEAAYLLMFGIFLVFFSARPWMLFKKKGRNFMGNGAYLLSTRDAYELTDAHKTLRLEVVEDMRMGLLMRAKGLRCAAAVGLDRIRRRWQPGFTGIFRGLLKNFFAGFEYNIGLTIMGVLFFPFVILGPWICLFFGYPSVGVAGLLMLMLCFYLAGRCSHLPWFTSFLLSPITALTASANLATSAFRTLKDGGVRWRGTLYPLSELRAHCLTVDKAFGKT